MSARGIPVFNAPGANANAVKELVIAGLIIGCRHLCQAGCLRAGSRATDAALHKAVEAGKKQFVGNEISGRTIGVVGLGAIGGNVANATSALGMHVSATTRPSRWRALHNCHPVVRRVDSLETLLAQSEFLTVHVPLLPATKNLINAER